MGEEPPRHQTWGAWGTQRTCLQKLLLQNQNSLCQQRLQSLSVILSHHCLILFSVLSSPVQSRPSMWESQKCLTRKGPVLFLSFCLVLSCSCLVLFLSSLLEGRKHRIKNGRVFKSTHTHCHARQACTMVLGEEKDWATKPHNVSHRKHQPNKRVRECVSL